MLLMVPVLTQKNNNAKLYMYSQAEAERGPYGAVAVVSKKGIDVLNLTSNRKIGSTTFTSKVFAFCAARE